MNFKNPKQRTKEVSISLEYTNAVDLKRVLAVLNDLIGSGVQMYSGDIKSTLKTGKESRFNFVQFYPDARRGREKPTIAIGLWHSLQINFGRFFT